MTDLIQDNEKHPFCRGNPAQGVLFVDAGVKNMFMRIDEKGIRRRTKKLKSLLMKILRLKKTMLVEVAVLVLRRKRKIVPKKVQQTQL